MDIAEKLEEYSLDLLNIVNEYIGKNYKLVQMGLYYNKHVKKNKDFKKKYKYKIDIHVFKSIIGSFLASKINKKCFCHTLKNHKMLLFIKEFLNMFKINITYDIQRKIIKIKQMYYKYTHQCGYINEKCKLHEKQNHDIKCGHSINCKMPRIIIKCFDNHFHMRNNCDFLYYNYYKYINIPIIRYTNIKFIY
jgi:hypothetical protein